MPHDIVNRGPCRAHLCRLRALVTVNVVASLGQAVAQPYYYPPPPRAYYGQPPSAYYYYYGPAPGGYYQSYGPGYPQAAIANPGYPPPGGPYYVPSDRTAGGWIAGLPPEDQPETNQSAELPPQFRRQLVAYATTAPAGTIIIDTPHTFLYLAVGPGKALR
jgi:hypothetical protein